MIMTESGRPGDDGLVVAFGAGEHCSGWIVAGFPTVQLVEHDARSCSVIAVGRGLSMECRGGRCPGARRRWRGRGGGNDDIRGGTVTDVGRGGAGISNTSW